ncbi:MAG: hypothetical protein ABIE43_05385 [Patescibacteria group bacterium]
MFKEKKSSLSLLDQIFESRERMEDKIKEVLEYCEENNDAPKVGSDSFIRMIIASHYVKTLSQQDFMICKKEIMKIAKDIEEGWIDNVKRSAVKWQQEETDRAGGIDPANL